VCASALHARHGRCSPASHVAPPANNKVARTLTLARRLAEMHEREAERAAKVHEHEAKMKAEAAARLAAQQARLESARARDAEGLARKRTEYELKLEEAAKRNLSITPRSAKEVQALAERIVSASPEFIAKVKQASGGE
jgi:hypothetical protein